MKQLPAVTVTITPDPMIPFNNVCVQITVQQRGKLPLHCHRTMESNIFKSYFDQVMEELINTIHKFYAEKGHIE